MAAARGETHTRCSSLFPASRIRTLLAGWAGSPGTHKHFGVYEMPLPFLVFSGAPRVPSPWWHPLLPGHCPPWDAARQPPNEHKPPGPGAPSLPPKHKLSGPGAPPLSPEHKPSGPGAPTPTPKHKLSEPGAPSLSPEHKPSGPVVPTPRCKH